MKKLLLLFTCILGVAQGWANPVSVEQARQKASRFVNNRVAAHARAAVKSPSNVEGNVQTQLKMVSVGDEQSYYIFNVGQNEGYVVVSGDDATDEILGYCDSGSINPDQMPCNMRAWMEGYAEQIKFIRKKGIKKTEAKASASQRYCMLDDNRLARFDQHPPYNDLCPEHNGKNSVTGCVATAMAQLLYYHKWPAATTYPIIGYKTESNGLDVAPVDKNTPIDWTNIQPTYIESKSYSKDQKTAVAELMRICGTAVRMNYSSNENGSSADARVVPFALELYFGYKTGASYKEHNNMSDEEWLDCLYKELKNDSPVILSVGASDGSRHAILCEGISGKDLKIDWGFNGDRDSITANGLFLYSALDAYDTDDYKFNFDQRAIIGVKPDRDGSNGEVPRRLSTTYIKSVGDKVYKRNPESGKFENITIAYKIENLVIPFKLTFDVGVAFLNVNNDDMVGNPGLISHTEFDYQSFVEKSFTIDEFPDLPDGHYKMCMASQWVGSDYIYPNVNSDVNYIDVVIANDKLLLDGVSPDPLEVTEIVVDNADMAGKTFTGTTLSGHFLLQNNNNKTNRDHVYVFVVEEGDNQKLNPDMDPIYCDLFVHPHKTQNLFFEFNQLQEGHRYAIAVTDFEMNEFYRSDYFTCLPDASETLAIGSFFKAKTVEGLELTYRVYRNNPKLVEIRSESGELWENAATDKSFAGHLTIPSTVNGYTVARLGNLALYDMQGITSVSIPSTVKQLGSYAFCDCYNLSRIDGMEAVESIGDVAFKMCNKMKTIPLPHTLKTIGKQAISDNAELEYQVIPSSVISIRDESLLLNCPKLRSVVVERGNTVYDSRGGCNAIIKTATNEVVAGCAATTIPFGVTKITNLNWVDNLERIELPPTVTEIDDYAFWCTNELRTVLSHIKNPMPIVDGKTFYASNRDINQLMTLYVPKGCLAKYRATEGWKSIVDIREMSERTEILRYFYNGWTYTLNKQAAGSSARRTNKAEGGSGDVRTDADGWEMYRSLLTLDVTDDKGNTNTYTVDDGGVFLDMSEYGTMQKPTLLVDNPSNKIWIFTNSKSEGKNYEMDGFMYSANLNELVFEKETVFENEDQGWYANLEQGENGQPQLNHYDMSEYVEVTTQRQDDATYVSEASTEITSPAEAEDNWNEAIKEPEPGDVNNDKMVDSSDLVALINAIALKMCDASTDVNGDNRVDIADVLSITRKIAVNQYLEKVEAVDLGLPSGTLWANCNLGATTPEEFGNLYAWAELTPKEEYEEENYAYNSYDAATKDFTYTDLAANGDISGMPKFDAATAMMGAPWRMPTYAEISELKENCQAEWTTINGIRGACLTGPNGNKIFLPATQYDNESGWYWSSRQYTGKNNPWALALYIDTDRQSIYINGYFRYIGFNIRPVRK